jgi:hypothetical protein
MDKWNIVKAAYIRHVQMLLEELKKKSSEIENLNKEIIRLQDLILEIHMKTINPS